MGCFLGVNDVWEGGTGGQTIRQTRGHNDRSDNVRYRYGRVLIDFMAIVVFLSFVFLFVMINE